MVYQIKFIILELLFREISNPQFVGRIKYKRKGPFFTKRTQETGSGLFSLLITFCVKGEIVYYN